eukprot:6307778-Amphidinium_carterae.1
MRSVLLIVLLCVWPVVCAAELDNTVIAHEDGADEDEVQVDSGSAVGLALAAAVALSGAGCCCCRGWHTSTVACLVAASCCVGMTLERLCCPEHILPSKSQAAGSSSGTATQPLVQAQYPPAMQPALPHTL